ncbi:proteinase inhibitor-like [Gastrophryne carolinensis]
MKTAILLTLVVSSLLLSITSADDTYKNCVSPPYSGACVTILTRYNYNATTNTCKPFKFAACVGNGNNYNTLEECEQTCKQE